MRVMGETTGHAGRPQMLTPRQEGKFLLPWAAEEVAALRRELDGEWEIGVTAAEMMFTAWQPDAELLADRDPRRLRDLIGAARAKAGATP